MNASKENAAKALTLLEDMEEPRGADFTFISQFLVAAQRKLPSEASYKKTRTAVKKPKQQLMKGGHAI